MADGWVRRLDLQTVAIKVPPGTKVNVVSEWTTLFTWNEIALGPTILEVEIAAKLPKPRPTDIQTRWVRSSASADTKRKTHSIGSVESWADVMTYLEFISADDLPISFQMWQKGTLELTVVKIIPKYLNPRRLIQERL